MTEEKKSLRWARIWLALFMAGLVLSGLTAIPIRGIPFFWQLIDCSFGVAGIVPLYLARRYTRRIIALGGRRTVIDR